MNSIQIWPFYQAPQEYQALSHHGGDEDWIALIPASIKEDILKYGLPHWMERLDTCHTPQQLTLDNGDILLIGAHS